MENFSNCKICNGKTKVINVKYNLGQCDDCKFIFCLNIYSQQQFIDVYKQLYNDENAIYKNHSTDEFNNLLDKTKKIKVGVNRSKLIKKNIFKSDCNSVLEIGSGVGLVGSYVKQNKPSINYFGIELDKEAFDKSQQLGLKAINADFTEMNNLTEKFDVIMMWEVIEHLQDLKLFLKLAYERLNDGGRIILSTPNYNKIFNYPNREKDQIFQSLPPVHLNFFTLENIKNIFELNNFKNCKAVLKKWPYFEPKRVDFYINTLKTLIGKHKGSTIYFVAKK